MADVYYKPECYFEEGKISEIKRTFYFHRTNGPAIFDGYGYIGYLINDGYHRLDGPAIISFNMRKSYWIKDKNYNENEYYMTIAK